MAPASAQTLRYANQGDLKSLDPYTLNESTTHAHLGHVYEGLIARDKDLKIIPALAESWETPEPTRWRFHLRKGVKFQNGDPFTADDVVFSADRDSQEGLEPSDPHFARHQGGQGRRLHRGFRPDLAQSHSALRNGIPGTSWTRSGPRQTTSVEPTPAAATTPSFASLNANGTGPFTVESHQPGVKTVFKANPNWWRKPEHNLKEIVFTPIGSDATRVAALLSGEVDVIEPVPLQDITRVDSSPNAQVLKGPELRTIFLGMDQIRDELLYSNVKGKNPFKDIRVREAFYKTVDVELIKTRVMRGLSTPSALMIAPQLFPLSKDFTRPKLDPDGAKKLLTEAGYPDGFEVTMDCPERPLCQRRRDLPGGGRHAGANRRQGHPAGAAQGAVLRQGACRPAVTRPRSICLAGLPERPTRTTFSTKSWAAATIQNPRAARAISAVTATRSWMKSPIRCCWRPIPPNAIC